MHFLIEKIFCWEICLSTETERIMLLIFPISLFLSGRIFMFIYLFIFEGVRLFFVDITGKDNFVRYKTTLLLSPESKVSKFLSKTSDPSIGTRREKKRLQHKNQMIWGMIRTQITLEKVKGRSYGKHYTTNMHRLIYVICLSINYFFLT